MHVFRKLRPRTETAEWQAWLPASVEIVLVALLVLQIVRLAWSVVAPTSPVGTTTASAAPTPTPPPSLPTVDVFFRNATVPSIGTDEALGYRLFGVRSAPGEGDSAILGKDGEQVSYAVGREVAPGIALESVGKQHAVLVANGANHRLELPRVAATNGATPVPAALPVGAPPQPAAPPAAATADASTAPTATSRAASPTDPAAAPADGYTITPGVRAALLRPAGLRPGDVVLSVNGRPLDPARLAGLKNELKGQTQLTIQYRRDGKNHTTTVQAPR